MRALGILSDKDIIEYCLLDLNKYESLIDLFIPSIHDANTIFNQQVALEFIAKFTKRQTVFAVQDILMNYFLYFRNIFLIIIKNLTNLQPILRHSGLLEIDFYLIF